MKTRLLKILRRLAKRKFKIECYNRKYMVIEKNRCQSYTAVHDIDTLDKAKEILQNQRERWIRITAMDLRAKRINKKLKRL